MKKSWKKSYWDRYMEELNENTGEMSVTDRETGEVLDAPLQHVPSGSIIFTPAEQREYRKRKEKERRIELWRNQKKKFVFIRADRGFRDVKPETAARLAYLATFLEYDSDTLFKTLKTPMQKRDLPGVLHLPLTTFYNFWKDATGRKYLSEDENGAVHISKTFFLRGKIPKDKRRWQCLYRSGMRALYEQTAATKHRFIGYVFQMLCFVHVERNILCGEPYEETLENSKPLTPFEFCQEIGYATNQSSRLVKAYSKITFFNGTQEERLLSFVPDAADRGKIGVLVNPNIVFRGY